MSANVKELEITRLNCQTEKLGLNKPDTQHNDQIKHISCQLTPLSHS